MKEYISLEAKQYSVKRLLELSEKFPVVKWKKSELVMLDTGCHDLDIDKPVIMSHAGTTWVLLSSGNLKEDTSGFVEVKLAIKYAIKPAAKDAQYEETKVESAYHRANRRRTYDDKSSYRKQGRTP